MFNRECSSFVITQLMWNYLQIRCVKNFRSNYQIDLSCKRSFLLFRLKCTIKTLSLSFEFDYSVSACTYTVRMSGDTNASKVPKKLAQVGISVSWLGIKCNIITVTALCFLALIVLHNISVFYFIKFIKNSPIWLSTFFCSKSIHYS